MLESKGRVDDVMAMSLELDYRLRWMDFDRYGRMQPTAILDLFQDVATIQADGMGIGRDDMMAKGVFWAVIRSKFEIVRNPLPCTSVKVRTWPHTPTRFSFLRDFSMRDEAGELLVKGTSEWVLMDAQTRKFASVKDYYSGSEEFDEARMFDAKPRKLADFGEGNLSVCTMQPNYTDIDVNGHVNNARYADFVVNALNPGDSGAIRTFQMDYRHEVMPHVPLHVHTLVEDGRIMSKGANEQGDIAFACLIELR